MSINKNATLFRALSSQAETLCCEVANYEFPVLLRTVAARRRVTSVEFRPLLVDAMLTTHPSGFRILFNSKGANPVDLSEKFESENRDRLLPARFRFSLAHELAHTFFYDLSDGKPQLKERFRSGGGRTELQNLEQSCNRLAAEMLLPTPMVRKALLRSQSIDPPALIQLAHSAGVSVETLVRRLSDEDSLLESRSFQGCVVLAKQTNVGTLIVSVARRPHLNIARTLAVMRSGEHWQAQTRDGSSLLPEALPPLFETELTVETSMGARAQRYKIGKREIVGRDSTVSYLITFEEVHPL